MHGARIDSNVNDKKKTPKNQDSKAATSLATKTSKRLLWFRLFPRLLLFIFAGALSFYLLLDMSYYLLDINLPQSLEGFQTLSVKLETMTRFGTWEDCFTVMFVMAMLYLWQQAFSMPGSIFLNLMAGQMYGMLFATLWTSYLTALGSVMAYYLNWMVGSPMMEIPCIQRRTDLMREQMLKAKSSTGLFWWLLFLRLFPFSPYWFLNLASPFLEIRIMPFFWTTFLGSMPYNYLCAQAGEVLGELGSTRDILTVSLVAKLLVVSMISLIPVVWGKSLNLKHLGKQEHEQDEEM